MNFFKKERPTAEPDSEPVSDLRLDRLAIEAILRHVENERDEINARAVAQLGLDRIDGWSLDLQGGTISFATPSGGLVGAVEVLGSLNVEANSWMWGWANPGVSDDLTLASFGVRQFGESKDIPSLMTTTLWADEQEADSLAALAFGYAQAQFLFRTPSSPVFYLAVRDIRAAPGSDQA